jgi:glycosyltransferase involved in cell wall biosynthesis
MLIEFIIPTYKRIDLLKCCIASIYAQSEKDWGVHVVVDDPEDDEVVPMIDNCFDWKKVKVSKMDKKYNDWGHTPREFGKQQSSAKYITMTGDDNYYTPNLLKEIKPMLDLEVGMVYWDMVHSSFGYSPFVCQPAHGQIDIGAFAVRTDLAQQITLNKDYAADGTFVEDFKKKFPRQLIKKLNNKILYVHN